MTSKQNTALDLQAVVSQWYSAIRNIAIVLSMSVLLYVGIRMLLSTVAQDKAKYKGLLLGSSDLLGILFQSPEEWFKGGKDSDEAEIEAQIAARAQAKKDKNWALADEIRNKLKEQGIILEDTPQGTTWKKL